MKSLFYILNALYIAGAAIVLLLSAVFYMGSKEQMDAQLSNYWQFVIARILFNEIVLILLVVLLFVINLCFYKTIPLKVRIRYALLQILYMSVASIAVIFLVYSYK